MIAFSRDTTAVSSTNVPPLSPESEYRPGTRFGANNSTDPFFDYTLVNGGGDPHARNSLLFMKRWIFVLFLCVVHSTVLRGKPFERAEVTKTVNLVSLLPQATPSRPRRCH